MLNLIGVKGVIFDLDGTLVESFLDFKQIRHEIGCPADQDILDYLDSLPKAQKIQAHEVILGHEIRDAKRAKILPNGVSMINQVKLANLPMAIVTRNCRLATQTKLANNHIDISLVFTREDAPAKPNPAALLQIAELWTICPSDILYVGDYIYDQQAAENAGMQWFLV